jgi:hypothetical protein
MLVGSFHLSHVLFMFFPAGLEGQKCRKPLYLMGKAMVSGEDFPN